MNTGLEQCSTARAAMIHALFGRKSKKNFLSTYLPALFSSHRYRKQTIILGLIAVALHCNVGQESQDRNQDNPVLQWGINICYHMTSFKTHYCKFGKDCVCLIFAKFAMISAATFKCIAGTPCSLSQKT